MMKRGRGEVVLGLPKIKRLYPDLCFDHPWKMEKTTKELETALPTLPQFIYMGTQVWRFYCPITWFRTKWRSSISQCLQWTLHWVSRTYTKLQVYNSHCQHVHVFLSFCSYECESLSHNCARTVRVSSYMWASCRGQCLSQWWAHRKREDTLYSHSGHKFTWFKQLLVLNMLGMHMKLFLVLKLNITASSLRQQKLPTKPLTLGAMIFKIFITRLQIFLYHFFSICWKTPLLGMRSVLWLLSSQWHAISQWVAHSSALKEYQRRISCARRCFSTLHPLNPNDFSTSSNVCI